MDGIDIEDGRAEGDNEPYTEVEHEGLGDRLQGACAGICVGLIVFLGSFPLLFWNEGRAVQRYDALNEAASQVRSVSGLTIDPADENQLVHFSVDMVNGGEDVVDPIFGIESDGLRLRRYAEMYQWVEQVQTKTSKQVGGGKTTSRTYTYDRQWRSDLVDSSSFKQTGHTNPSYMDYASETFDADPIMIGAYEIPHELISRIDWEETLRVGVENITDQSIRDGATSTRGGFFFGNSTSQSRIGDQRVSFFEAPPAVVTIVGVQSGGRLVAFSETDEGGDVLLFRRGRHSAAAMFKSAEDENEAATWMLRFVGFLAMALGLYLVARPVEVFADVVPCVGSVVGCGIVFVSVLTAAILSTITISIAWLVARPIIGAAFLVVSLAVVGGCAFGAKRLGKMKGKDVDNDSNDGSPPTLLSLSGEKIVAVAAPVAQPSIALMVHPIDVPPVPPPVYAAAAPTVQTVPASQVQVANSPAEPTLYTSGPYVPN